MGKTKRRISRGRARSGREPLTQRGHASTGLSFARNARCVVGVRTVVFIALSARSAVGLESASTVVSALGARSAVGYQSASTVVGALCARNAVGAQSASTVVCALCARSAVGVESASTVVGAIDARSARSSSVGRPPHPSDEQGRRVTNNQYSISVVLDPVAPSAEAAGVLIHLHRARPRAPVPLNLRPHGLPTRRLRLIQRRPVVV